MTGVIREARIRNGVGLRELARRLDVSPGTVQGWERADERGTAQLSTIERALNAVGERAVIGIASTSNRNATELERREDRVSLELHRTVAKHLIDDPDRTLAVAPENLSGRRRNSQGATVVKLLDKWEDLIDGRRIGELIDVLIGTDRHAVEMRQLSPFAGVLSQDERLQAIRRASQS